MTSSLKQMTKGHWKCWNFTTCSKRLLMDVALCNVQRSTLISCASLFFSSFTAAVINVVCGKDSITISVIEDFFKYYNIGLGSVHLVNPECRARKEVIAGVAFFTVRTPKDKYEFCGGKPVLVRMSICSWGLFALCDPCLCFTLQSVEPESHFSQVLIQNKGVLYG